MTGFGRAEVQIGEEKLVIEIRTLNSKQLDLNLRMPSSARELEMEMRKHLTQSIERGKVELSYSSEGGMERKAEINSRLATEYHAQLKSLSQELGVDTPDAQMLALILKMPEVMQTQREEMSEERAQQILSTVKEACVRLNAFRAQEGDSLAADIRGHIEHIQQLQKEVEPHIDGRVDRIRDRIAKQLDQLKESKDHDPARFEQELIYYIEKYDVSEEMTRLAHHCSYFIETMASKEPIGKKLGFICQEIGREINTLGSKSYDSEMQRIVVRMKDDLEKIKEQSLNVL